MPSKTEKPNANFDVSANLLKKLAETMGNAGLSEIEYVDGERSLRLSRATQAPVVRCTGCSADDGTDGGTDGGTDRRRLCLPQRPPLPRPRQSPPAT